MIERYVFIRLKSEHATERGRSDLMARSQVLRSVPGVRGLTIGTPGDADAGGAWDLCLTLRFDALAEVERYLQHAAYQAYQGVLQARAQVIKAWNFEVSDDGSSTH